MVLIDLYVEQGSTFSQEITLGSDNTGNTISGTITDSANNSTSGIATSFTDETDGTFSIELTEFQTAHMSSGIGRYDIEVRDGDTVTKPIGGAVYVKGEVTI